MDLIMNGLLLTATLFAGLYCWVLSGRVRALKSLDSGLGAAIVTLTRQIELARGTLEDARASTRESRSDLSQLVARGDATAAQLRILLAALRDHEPGAAAIADHGAPATPGLVPPDPEAARAEAAPAAREYATPPRRAEVALPRLVVREPERGPEAEPEPEPTPTRPALASVPKPRLAIPLENILRSRQPVEAPVERSESELLDALSALAAGDR